MDRRFCRENDLDWVFTFTALGIEYDVNNIRNITIKNIENKIDSMRKLIQLWMYRNITPIGRICIAKSLILSKITHVLQALPSPPNTYLKKNKKMLIDFIWREKRHELSKRTIYFNHQKGCLNMVDITEFHMSLKITWMRKIILGNPEWVQFAQENYIDSLLCTGENYHQQIYLKIKKTFWRSVAYSYKKWYTTLRKHVHLEIGDEPIWGNPQILMPFNNNLYMSNVINVKHLFSQEGTRLSKEQLEAKTGKNIMLTTYFALWKALPKHWINELTNKTKLIWVQRPFTIQWLTKDEKGTRNIRKVWRLNEEPDVYDPYNSI